MNDRTALRTCGVLFCLLAVSNFIKFLEFDSHTGFMLFGMRQRGVPNFVFGWLFGLYLLIYGIGVFRMRTWALPMGIAYAVYVVLNLVLFMIRMPEEAFARPIFGLVYIIVAVGVSSGAVYLLQKNRHLLT